MVHRAFFRAHAGVAGWMGRSRHDGSVAGKVCARIFHFGTRWNFPPNRRRRCSIPARTSWFSYFIFRKRKKDISN